MKKFTLSFIGKDSVPFTREIELPDEIYDEFKKLYDAANSGEEIFNKVNSADVSKFLNEAHKGISPKVLRTAKCNEVLVENLKKQNVDKNSTEAEKIRAIYRANLEIAKTLNHQKNVAKNFKEQETKAQEKVEKQQDNLKKLAEVQTEKLAKLDEDAKKIKKQYANMPAIKASKLEKIDEKRAKLQTQLDKANARIEKAEFNLTKKQETKDINLGTSLGAYADFRIIMSWCKDIGLDPSKIYTKALLEKGNWAKDTPASYWKK